MSTLTRRQFLKQVSAASCAGLVARGISPFSDGVAFAQSRCLTSKKVVVSVFLAGGPHAPSILVPRASPAYFDKHPTLGVTNSLPIDTKHGLSPLLPNLYRIYQQGQLAIGAGSGYPNHSRSHEEATNAVGRAIMASSGNVSGYIGRYAQTYCDPTDIFSLFSFRGRTTEVVAPGVTALTGSDLASFGYIDDNQGAQNNLFINKIIKDNRLDSGITNSEQQAMLESWEVGDAAIPVIKHVDQASNPTTYGGGSLGKKFRDARKLITYPGISVQHILIGQGGYDMHEKQKEGLTTNLSELDQAIWSFWKDITAAGRANDVIIVAYGEFGRTHENKNGGDAQPELRGTDHGTGGIFMVIGKNIRRGVFSPAYTDLDFTGPKPWMPVKFDYREVLWQILEKHQDVDPAPIFPEPFNRIGLSVFL